MPEPSNLCSAVSSAAASSSLGNRCWRGLDRSGDHGAATYSVRPHFPSAGTIEIPCTVRSTPRPQQRVRSRERHTREYASFHLPSRCRVDGLRNQTVELLASRSQQAHEIVPEAVRGSSERRIDGCRLAGGLGFEPRLTES